ncbi:hypothetical protein MHYP_G00107170 [Metynnis hypsauchen]
MSLGLTNGQASFRYLHFPMMWSFRKPQKVNEAFKNNSTTLNITRGIKVHVWDKLAEAVYLYKAYPKDSDLEKVNAEFQCTNHIGLKSTLLTSLDSHTRGLLKMYRVKANQGGGEMEELLEKLDVQAPLKRVQTLHVLWHICVCLSFHQFTFIYLANEWNGAGAENTEQMEGVHN